MTREEREEAIKYFEDMKKGIFPFNGNWLFDMAIGALKQEPCEDAISIPYLMHKEMDIPLSECQKAYDVAIDYLRSQGKVKG